VNYLVIFVILVACAIIAPLIVLVDNDPAWPSRVIQVIVAIVAFVVPLNVILLLSLCGVAGRESRREEEENRR